VRRTTIHITDRQRERLRALANRTGLCSAELLRRAVDDYLDRELPEGRDQAVDVGAATAR